MNLILHFEMLLILHISVVVRGGFGLRATRAVALVVAQKIAYNLFNFFLFQLLFQWTDDALYPMPRQPRRTNWRSDKFIYVWRIL